MASKPVTRDVFTMTTPGTAVSKKSTWSRGTSPSPVASMNTFVSTKGVTIENTTIHRMRGGIGLEAALPPVKVSGCKVTECEYAYYVGTDAIIQDSAAGARHGPALVTFAAAGGDHIYAADHLEDKGKNNTVKPLGR